jgi:putative exosortase-associated protein (TIGR04073 family)
MILNIASVVNAQDMGRKLYRGVVNTVSGWVEIPKNVYVTTMKHEFGYGFIIGLPQGFLMAAARTAAGVYDTLTFPIPFPKDYKPVLEPEFVADGKPLD